jgi:hypothetical protein
MRLIAIAIIALSAACTRAPLSNEDSAASPQPGSTVAPAAPEGDSAAIEKLEQEAKAIAKTNGCTASSDCRTAPVGSRACGGPRYYLPYCARSTDSVALFRKLDEVSTAEKAYNTKHQVVSTCEFRMPPAVEAVGGVCTAR